MPVLTVRGVPLPPRRAKPVIRRSRTPTPAEKADRKAFGLRLRELRLAQELSQEALAERADLHRNMLGTIERGESGPTLDSILALARGLDLPAARLFEGWGETTEG